DVWSLPEQLGVCPPAACSLRCPTCPRFCPSKPQTQAGLDPKFGYFSWNAQNLDRIRVRPMPVPRMAYLLRLFSLILVLMCGRNLTGETPHPIEGVSTSTMGISLRRLSCGTVTSVTGSGQMPVFGADISRSRARILSMTLL